MTATSSDKIVGIDEAGRGPLAGPVYAAAVILPGRYDLPGLTDSKLLNKAHRDRLAHGIKQQAISWSVAKAEVLEIDELNILQATLLAMQRAVRGLAIRPRKALVDGDRAPDLDCKVVTIIKGDMSQPQISAAAILAKVERDKEMVAHDKHYPEYGWAQNKGYATPHHLRALQQFGATPVHRRSFAPVRSVLAQIELVV